MFVLRRDANGSVFIAGRRATDQQRHLHVQSLHLFGDVNHLIKAWRNQSRQTDHVDIVLDGFFENLVTGNHHAKVDDFVVVATKHHADNVLADIVNVTFDRRQQNLAAETLTLQTRVKFFLLHERQQVSNGFLHHASRLHNLRQKHFPAAEQIADNRHAVHHGTFDDRKTLVVLQPRFFSIVDDIFIDAFYKCV